MFSLICGGQNQIHTLCIYTCTYSYIKIHFFIYNIFLKVGLLEETEEENKKRIIVNNINILHLCVGTRHNKMC
jgi:hypothetical protein